MISMHEVFISQRVKVLAKFLIRHKVDIDITSQITNHHHSMKLETDLTHHTSFYYIAPRPYANYKHITFKLLHAISNRALEIN